LFEEYQFTGKYWPFAMSYPQAHAEAPQETLPASRQGFDDSHFAADQLRFQKRQEARLRAKARALGFQLILSQPPA
jgi:hypothetical protein